MEFLSRYERHLYSGFEPSQVFDIVYGGHFEHRLLSARRSTMEHQRLVLGSARIETGCYDFPVIAQGAMPPESVCIGFVAQGAEITRFNTQLIGEDEIQVYGAGAELTYHATGASRWINFTSPQSALQDIAQRRFGQALELPRHGVESFRLRRGERARLRELADDAFALGMSQHPGAIGAALGQAVSQALTVAYVDALCTAERPPRGAKTKAAQRHHHLILACERLVTSRGVVEPDLREIARRSGYSLRSLERIFLRGVGESPGRWFTNIRLNGALRDLIDPIPGCSVTDVATRWGFRHLSRFAEQYRLAFGELPSDTLRGAVNRSK